VFNDIPGLEDRYLEVMVKLKAYEQEHLLDHYQKLDGESLSSFIEELNKLDFDKMDKERKKLDQKKEQDKITPYPAKHLHDLRTTASETKATWRKKGLEAISRGEVAVVLVAGGQGTRLGFNKPKGMYNIGLPSNKTLFQLQAEKIQKLRALARKYTKKNKDSTIPAPRIPWYIMTSEATHSETVDFLLSGKDAKIHRGNLPREDVKCFRQGMMPCVSKDGKKILLSSVGKIAESPNGNGGLYSALAHSGILKEMKESGIKYVHAYCVDNALTKIADPYFIGFCIDTKADAANKVLPKREPNERVGVMCLRNDEPGVCEYSEITERNKNMRDRSGNLVFGAANICSHFFTTEFLVKFIKEEGGNLPFHIARKAIPTIDEAGRPFKPSQPNGIKMEMFIFDIFAFAENVKCLMVPRASEFSPVKNKPGVGKMDAPDVARADVNRYHISLLKSAGYQISTTAPQGRGAVSMEFNESSFTEQTLKDFSRLNSFGAPKFVLVYGAYVDDGSGRRESWCPDTTTAMGLINKELKDVFANGTYFMLKLPVERQGSSVSRLLL